MALIYFLFVPLSFTKDFCQKLNLTCLITEESLKPLKQLVNNVKSSKELHCYRFYLRKQTLIPFRFSAKRLSLLFSALRSTPKRLYVCSKRHIGKEKCLHLNKKWCAIKPIQHHLIVVLLSLKLELVNISG